MNRKYKPWLQTLSGIFQNLSVAFLALVFITPNFTFLHRPVDILILTQDMLFAMLFLLLSVRAEKILEYEQF